MVEPKSPTRYDHSSSLTHERNKIEMKLKLIVFGAFPVFSLFTNYKLSNYYPDSSHEVVNYVLLFFTLLFVTILALKPCCIAYFYDKKF